MKRIPLILAAALVLAVPATRSLAATVEDHVLLHEPYEFAAQQAQLALSDSSAYAVNIMDQNKVGMTISNYGFIGTNFTSRAPSFEYPLGTGYQHMVRGGIWIGAFSYDTTAFVGVSTAAQDGSAGSAAAGATEFTPGTNAVHARSTLPNSRYYKVGSVSELDFVSLYSDRPAKKATGNKEDHRSIGVVVTQYNYSWSFSDYANINFFHYVLRNDGPPLDSVYVGMYSELASGNMTLSSVVPPSGWFGKKQVAWVDSLNLFAENYCLNNPIPANCNYQAVPEVAGIKLLGTHPGNLHDPLDKRVTMACWRYSPGDTSRAYDVQRYAIMNSGRKTSLSPLPTDLAPYSGDPVELIAVGPFPVINPGDSVSVDFAYIGAPMDFNSSGQLNYTTLIKRAVTAQRAYDLNYLVPVPPPSPRYKIVPHHNAVDFYWDNSPESFIDPTTSTLYPDFEGYRLYLGEDRQDLRLVAQYDLATGPARNDTTGFNTGFAAVTLSPPVVIDGVTYHYKYTITNLRDGFKFWGAITSYDVGTPQIESLESGIAQNEQMFVPAPTAAEAAGHGVGVFPNPYKVETAWDKGLTARRHFLWFANLPTQCSLKIYTLSGALIYETSFDGKTYDGSNARGIYQPANDLPSLGHDHAPGPGSRDRPLPVGHRGQADGQASAGQVPAREVRSGELLTCAA